MGVTLPVMDLEILTEDRVQPHATLGGGQITPPPRRIFSIAQKRR